MALPDDDKMHNFVKKGESIGIYLRLLFKWLVDVFQLFIKWLVLFCRIYTLLLYVVRGLSLIHI